MPTVRLLIFVVTYALIAVRRVPGLRINRAGAALLGAVAMIVFGGLSLHDAYRAIDLDVIVFLFGVLLLTSYLDLGGFFEWAAGRIVTRVRSPHALLAAIVVASGLLSGLFVNDTICLVFTPLVIVALRPLRLSPIPFLLAIALASNVGSAMTITGNPQNMLIGVSSGVGFGHFLAALALPSLGGLVIVYVVVARVYRKELAVPLAAGVASVESRLDAALVIKALVVFAGALAGWLAGLSLPLVAIAAATLLMFIANRDAEAAFARVEWSLLVFFAALFIVMRAVRDLPAFVDLTTRAVSALDGRAPHDVAIVSGAMVVLSNLVSNVPAVLLWIPAVPRLAHPRLIWLALALSSTFAGNLTLLGSMANLIVAERAARRGVVVRFLDYLRVGVPVTVLTLLWGVTMLLVIR